MRARIEQRAQAAQVLDEDALEVGQRVQQGKRRDLRRPDHAERHPALVGGIKEGAQKRFSPGLGSDALINRSRLIRQRGTSCANLRPGPLCAFRDRRWGRRYGSHFRLGGGGFSSRGVGGGGGGGG